MLGRFRGREKTIWSNKTKKTEFSKKDEQFSVDIIVNEKYDSRHGIVDAGRERDHTRHRHPRGREEGDPIEHRHEAVPNELEPEWEQRECRGGFRIGDQRQRHKDGSREHEGVAVALVGSRRDKHGDEAGGHRV